MTGPAAQLLPCAAALSAGGAAWLLTGGRTGAPAARLLPPGAAPGRRRLRLPSRADGTLTSVLCCLAAGGVVALWGRSLLPLAAAALLAPLAARWWRGRCGSRDAARRADAVIGFCAAVAGEVRAGRQPEQALRAAGPRHLGAPAAAVTAAARYGGDVPAALRQAAGQPGAEGLRAVAACWQVAVDGGASLASGLDRVADSLRAERDQREELRAQLSGPRATALVLAALPVFGLLLGSAMGVQPLVVLLHSPAGLACLVGGALLEWAGLAWVAAIVRSAERAAA
ncbi:type II secretion system F family protein [Streptomyces sp. ACA25]|uniref:type II secretion system F family protein n=1 Tax=Streptomyces sp. ACA25 TaxID=3022596 RepID=UPI002307DE4D|nr:type II secretion system F family protein [Streptomyces sp. ACA25]MDB1086523.1 type II secretion system F family protein [Streptomyces sp. ACA25]